jgi:hypothetical protein
MFSEQGTSAHRKFQLIINGEYFDSFNSFFDALRAGRKFQSITITDSYDAMVVYSND